MTGPAPATTIETAIREIEEEFALFSDWEERYAHVIDLGRAAPGLPESERVEQNRVRGCASQVWLTSVCEPASRRLVFAGDSDAYIVRGLVALMLRVFSQRTPAEILSVAPGPLFTRLGLDEALSLQRSNGLAALVARIQAAARAAAP
jgi:cysteine desulfuration protein SufE